MELLLLIFIIWIVFSLVKKGIKLALLIGLVAAVYILATRYLV